jgi:Family of unknown function (DUF6399)
VQPEGAVAPVPQQSPPRRHLDSHRVAARLELVSRVQQARCCGLRPVAAELGVARSTLQDQRRAVLQNGLPPALQPLFGTEAGLDFLRKLVVVLLVVLVVRGGVSVALVSQCLILLGLGRVIACSTTSLRRVLERLVPFLLAWGQEQKDLRAKGMNPRKVVLVVDENFHWLQMLLVGVDLGTGYLFCEVPSEKRDGETWEKVLRASIEGLKVTICALGRDGAKGLANCAKRLAVADGPDIFHIQHCVHGAVARPMQRREAAAAKEEATSREELATVLAARAKAADQPRGPGRPIEWDKREAAAREAITAAEATTKQRSDEREAMRQSIRALGDHYHPVDLATGEVRSAEQVRERLEDVVEDLCANAAKANLGMSAIRAISRVYRCLDELKATVQWWHQEVDRRLSALALTLSEQAWVVVVLVPAMYLRRRVELGRDKVERQRLGTLADSLWQRVQQGGPWQSWTRERRHQILQVVVELVLHFPRSTSAVEGRNGQDALCMHQHHQISELFRQARVVVHNDVIQRPDGTTAGERLFGKKPSDLIEYLCERIKLPDRGRRPRKAKESPLLALAA